MHRLGVLGWPVAHSRSPQIQDAALRAAGLADWRYQLLPVPPELFAETVRALPAAGFRGANVTIPHKLAALSVADSAGPAARAIGAANTLIFEPGGAAIHAENTDGPGLIDSLPFPPSDRSAVVLGAGGSARAAVWALLDGGASRVSIWSRRSEAARTLARELGGEAVTAPAAADLLINCTPVGLDASQPDFKGLPISADELSRYHCVVDFVYRESETPLLRAAREHSVPVVDGLTLLIAQGARSFEHFTGRPASPSAMRGAAGHGTGTG